MKDPEQLRSDLDSMIELERRGTRGNPSKEAKLWADRLAEAERKRARYQEMAADDLITFDELRAKLVELDEARKTAERELADIRSHKEHLRGLERDRDALLDSLTPEERHRWYKMLRLNAAVYADGTLEVSWAGAPDGNTDGEKVCEDATLRRPEAR